MLCFSKTIKALTFFYGIVGMNVFERKKLSKMYIEIDERIHKKPDE